MTSHFDARMKRHQHNAIFGSLKMAQSALWKVADGTTTTTIAKVMAEQLLRDLAPLLAEVYNDRVEPDGSTVSIRHDWGKTKEQLAFEESLKKE